jgi:phage replication-related protein YjqB (UPF0714/DUF867 family)
MPFKKIVSDHRISGMNGLADSYRGFADLANAHAEGADYRVHIRPIVSSSIAVIAPHGGRIEQYTSDIARGVAGGDFNLYLFEGIRQAGNYATLHLTSHRFDEPRCLSLLSKCDHVVAIHGCSGDDQRVLLGGLDEALKPAVGQALAALGVEVRSDGHQFSATDPKNICNRGRRGVGVQVEMTMGLRRHGPRDAICAVIRSVLLTLPHECQRGVQSQ